MSELGFNISGLITGIIGVAAVIPPLAYWFYYYLPTPKLREVEQRLKEAEVHFEEVLKSGLLTDVEELHRLYANFWSLQFRVDDARGEVYNIRTKSDELACWWKGLSSDMAVICQELVKFRARLSSRRVAVESDGLSPQRDTQHSSLLGLLRESTWYTLYQAHRGALRYPSYTLLPRTFRAIRLLQPPVPFPVLRLSSSMVLSPLRYTVIPGLRLSFSQSTERRAIRPRLLPPRLPRR
ncbi:hypothetical protein NUW54_g9930 [Trametes sanguinea]|uniref:Uncharacterized protein n=1 Tax=Trametes sanguinea TaxID=158606 RepID=A0ACC1P5M3_9APHY|nr:hypothetical protein NUW54_g9930 [Trametes sanguinea]